MRTYTEFTAIETREVRFEIRNGLREDVDALKSVYRETRDGTPAETVAAYIEKVGYNRAVVAIGTLINRHGWDGRISRRAAAWAAALPEAWDEKTGIEFGLYVDDVIHLAHFDQIVSAFMKANPDPGPDGRPETISEENTPEAAAQADPEAKEERPEIISNIKEEEVKKMKYNKATYSTIGRYVNGQVYGILTRIEWNGYIPEGIENIGIRKVKNWWYVDHIPTGLAVNTCGYKSREAAISDYLKNYAEKVKDAEHRMQKAVETFQAAPLDEEVAAWETVNYCTTYNYRFDKVHNAARCAGLIIRNADKNTYLDGGNINISGAPEALKHIREMIAEYDRRDAERAAEEAAALAALAEPETVEAEPEAVAMQEPETAEERPETISEEAAPEAAQADPEAEPDEPEAEPEKVERASWEKPARGPVKPKEFISEALTGRGWCIVFDSGMNRTRVIVQDGIRDKVAPMIEEAGFWWSDSMQSYNKKLSHKAHRAAVALAEKLTAATA